MQTYRSNDVPHAPQRGIRPLKEAQFSYPRRWATPHISLSHVIISELIPFILSFDTLSYTRRSLLFHVLRRQPAHRILFHARSTNRRSQRRTRTAFRQLQQNPLFWYPHRLRDWAHSFTRCNRSTRKFIQKSPRHFNFFAVLA